MAQHGISGRECTHKSDRRAKRAPIQSWCWIALLWHEEGNYAPSQEKIEGWREILPYQWGGFDQPSQDVLDCTLGDSCAGGPTLAAGRRMACRK